LTPLAEHYTVIYRMHVATTLSAAVAAAQAIILELAQGSQTM